ncbi:unnamed protein product [Parnassius apollo]|uniref:(apollo) hypothetical protein n=1 Tax=Parnassius apollo TaxID=110799 RepID=A0A8S3X9A8_PARAO|nr:unnamed protein product [Parnassius apollo]
MKSIGVIQIPCRLLLLEDAEAALQINDEQLPPEMGGISGKVTEVASRGFQWLRAKKIEADPEEYEYAEDLPDPDPIVVEAEEEGENGGGDPELVRR